MIAIDYRDGRPLYEQVIEQIETLALRGALPADSQLPSVRQLAVELSINPNTIQRAYGELEQRGVIYSVRGKGNFIASSLTVLRQDRVAEISRQIAELVRTARALGATEEQLRTYVQEEEGEHR